MRVIEGKSASPQKSGRDIFTGEVETHTYVDESIGKHLRVTLVRFAPGARTKWHTHSFEQGLIITEGRGIVAVEDQEQVVEAADIVIVAAGEKHWHGGTPSTAMAHMSITTPGETVILEPVERVRSGL